MHIICIEERTEDYINQEVRGLEIVIILIAIYIPNGQLISEPYTYHSKTRFVGTQLEAIAHKMPGRML